ncbi:hypothetical protein EVAR_16225_1 [Eumeta japonica]|uniref:Uncharacterized protein n=1 Tax=Eumeta variegata TaxID=151549 RepID=A0A4C1U5X6_EUMVA|nr:hypothetical protein EVAR_16225_1 [Eumeta japonica]
MSHRSASLPVLTVGEGSGGRQPQGGRPSAPANHDDICTHIDKLSINVSSYKKFQIYKSLEQKRSRVGPIPNWRSQCGTTSHWAEVVLMKVPSCLQPRYQYDPKPHVFEI